ncbi:hypothetical protein K7432_016487 [Basidiobolus ranarum]|uniref:Cytochrome P450 n=1 Tax=Basidiobolus ranarum TaxID=34480 RepID=A0ABR2WEQ4_9FUNG
MQNTVNEEGDSDKEKRYGMHQLTSEQIRGNLLNVIMAGYDTVATTMSWILYELAKSPEYQERIRVEANASLGDVNRLDLEKDFSVLEKVFNTPGVHVPFINAFVQETFRLHSVIPLLQVHALNDQEIRGVKIVKGTEIFLLNRVATLRSWPTFNPFKFNPVQWLDADETLLNAMNQVILTFGFGPRVCPGRHLAEMNLIAMVILITANFQLSLIDMPPSAEPVHEKGIPVSFPANIQIRIEPIESC